MGKPATLSPFIAFGRVRVAVLLLFLILVISMIFRWFPALDFWASDYFATEDGFALAFDQTWRGVRRFSINLTKGLVVVYMLLWIFRISKPEKTEDLSFAKLGFPAAALLAGPALITNIILKDNWSSPAT